MRDELNDLYKLHLAAKDMQHGVWKEDWSLFYPSKLVYAFFAFNSFYSIDWEESIQLGYLVKFDIGEIDSDRKSVV